MVVAASPCVLPMAATGINRIAAPVAYVWVRLSKEQTQMSGRTVNVPLLRKAVEWAEAEAAKPFELSEWFQGDWVVTAAARAEARARLGRMGVTAKGIFSKAPECGTCYCMAGYVAQAVDPRFENQGRVGGVHASDVAQIELGLDSAQADWLFAGSNTIEGVRRIAESIAGERL